MGFNKVKFRGLLEDLDISRRPEITTEINKTKKLFADYGIAISGISISARFAVIDPEERKKQFDEAKRNVAIAAELDVPILRIFGSRVPGGRTLNTI